MNVIATVRDLSDYPRIRKLASALHRLDASHHGAAIMIGAGFSRSAAHHVGGQKRAPLWTQITSSLIQDLYPVQQDVRFADPLRIAEEFRAYYGQAALNDRIRLEIENDAWRPGSLYQLLLELPWSEVLTTNWDTLLEQAATQVHSPYYTSVTKTSDLAWAQSPRIVKLHGTIGVTDSFIVAQEDYRTYPEQFAPFVNLTRQVFIENELCLLGFSGDDPNFLQWAGWVRDHLAAHARRIYLVGALNLSAARRTQLESINIAPVDLHSAVAHLTDPDLRHQTAIELFLQAMKEEAKSRTEPHEWQPTSFVSNPISAGDITRMYQEPEYGAAMLAGKLDTLRRDRESYPGWVVCPPTLRWRLSNQITTPLPNAKNIAALNPDDRARLLYEIAWRHSLAFEYVSPWLSDALFDVANPDRQCVLSERQQMQICITLLHNTRLTQSEDEQQTAAQRANELIAMLEKHAPYVPDCEAEIAYHHAISARDRLDYIKLSELIEKIVGEDPIWKLRQAALLMELGRSEEAAKAIALAYGELRENHRRDRRSIPILSRLVWAHWLLKASTRGKFGKTEEKLPTFAESNSERWKCDPWSWIEELRSEIEDRREKYLKRQAPIEPLFDQGVYREHSAGSKDDGSVRDFLLLNGLSREIGIPLYMDTGGFGVNLLGGDAEKIVLYGGTGIELVDLTLAIRSANSEDAGAIKRGFTRVGVARFSQNVVNVVFDRVLSAITYWRRERIRGTKDQQLNAISDLRVFLEVAARLSVRVSPAQAKDLFLLGVSIGLQAEMQHPWLFEVTGDLLTHSLKSVPVLEQNELLAKALSFPLQSEVPKGGVLRWPNPVIDHPGSRGLDPALGVRIAQLIAAAASGEREARTAPLLRLLPLARKSGFLTEVERTSLAAAIWGDSPEYGELPDTGLLPHALLLLPVMDEGHAEALVRSHLYEHGANVLEDTQRDLRVYPSPEIQRAIGIYDGIASAAANEAIRLLPTAEQAIEFFDRLTAWRPPTVTGDLSQLASKSRKRLAESIGRALYLAIVPALTGEARTTSRLDKIRAFSSEIDGGPAALPALVYFSSIDCASARTIQKIIRVALRSRDPARVGYAAIGIRKWMELRESRSSDELKSLMSMIIDIAESGRAAGLQQIIWLAGELVDGKWLSEDELRALIDSVPAVLADTDYVNVDPFSSEAVIASTIRAACVKLAHGLQQQCPSDAALNEVIARSQRDPLPEVRFALSGID